MDSNTVLTIYAIVVVAVVPLLFVLREKSRKFAGPYFGGFAAVLISLILETHISRGAAFPVIVVFWAPFVEEFSKAIIIIAFTNILKDEGTENVFWVWLFIGLGFGLGENGLYTTYLINSDAAMTTIISRTLFPVALHIVTTVVTGWLIERTLSGKKISFGVAILYAIILSLPAVVIHYWYNLSVA